MFKAIIPDLFVQSIYEIDFIHLQHEGIKGVIVDLDNTLVAATRPDATPELVSWLDQLRGMGFRVMIVSNNNETRVSKFAMPLRVPYIHRANKPLGWSFRKAMDVLETRPEETVMVGDQLFTDVLGGNRIGLQTILVVPVSRSEGFFTKMQPFVGENRILLDEAAEMGGQKVTMDRHQDAWCEGCGVTLQTADPKRPGYMPESALKREKMVCRRCFRIRHYNEIAAVEHDSDAYLSLLGEISNRQALVVQVVDLFDISGSWIEGIHRHTGGNPLLILGNKLDLFPKSVNPQRLKERVYSIAKEMGIKPVDVILTSAAKGYRIQEVAEAIEHYRQGRDVFVVGTANAGKSTLINRLLQEFGEGEEGVTTSPYPGTTLDAIQIPLDDQRKIVDMPGIVRKDRISEWISPKELTVITPRTELKPKGYQLNEGQTLFFGGLARFDFVRGERQPFVCYVAHSLYIHRTRSEKADEVWQRHRGELLSPPSEPAMFPPMQKHTFHLSGREKEDLVISGLGWIALGNRKASVHLWAPEGVQVHLRPALL